MSKHEILLHTRSEDSESDSISVASAATVNQAFIMTEEMASSEEGEDKKM